MKDIQDRILSIMSIKNVTNAEFAAAIGVLPSNISHILSGRNKPSLDLVVKIVKRYPEIRLEWLLQADGSMNKEYGMDSFSPQTPEKTIIEKRISSTKSKIQKQEGDFGKTSLSFNVKNEPVAVKSLINQGDRDKSKGANEVDRKVEFLPDSANSDAEIEKIVVFYRDRTFEVYRPDLR